MASLVNHSRPLRLKKGRFNWGQEEDMAFEQLKSAMTHAPVLALPYFSKTFLLETDACDVGIGAVLMQDGRPLSYLKALGIKNRGLSTYEKEWMALIMAVTKWRHYLWGRQFIIKTDHESLKFLLEQKFTSTQKSDQVDGIGLRDPVK